MDFEKMKQWMEVTQKYQNNKFWDMIFETISTREMMDDFENQQDPNSGHILQRIFRKQILFLLKQLLFYYWKFQVH